MASAVWTTLLEDHRDRSLALTVLASSALLPSAIYLFWAFNSWLAVAHLAVHALLLERFVTMFHDAHHRRLFRRRWNALNHYLFWCLGPLFGSTPESYFVHHIGMHHPEGNLEADISSTLAYRRDSVLDFIRYYLRFFFSWGELRRYLVARGRNRLARRSLVGEATYLAVTALAFRWDARAALVVLILPLLLMRSVLIIGNWAEHAFIDPDDAADPYKSSTNLIGKGENLRAFNVGYHIGHHLNPAGHFEEKPTQFSSTLPRYAERDALVFKDLNYPGLWWRLMTKNLEGLADRWVPLPGARTQTREQVLQLMNRRLAPIVRPAGLSGARGVQRGNELDPV